MANEEQQSIPDNQQLTHKQQLFVDAYLGEAKGNASEAARIAGYRSPGQEGYRLLKNAEIQRKIGGVLSASAMSRDEVLERLSRIARGVMPDFITLTDSKFDGGFKLDLAKAMKNGAANYIRKIKKHDDGSVSLEVYDKLRALQLVGQYHGIFGAASGDGGEGGNGGKGSSAGSEQHIKVEIEYVDERPRQPKGDD